MCTWGDTVMLRVPIPAELSHTGDLRWADKPVDRCISGFVQRLNESWQLTASCCCGHGRGVGWVTLHDGTQLVILTGGHLYQEIDGKDLNAADPARRAGFEKVLVTPRSEICEAFAARVEVQP